MTDQQKQQESIVPKWRHDALKKALSEGPRNAAGDPCLNYAQLHEYFTPSEISWLCNKALYQEDYQASYHAKRLEKKKLLRRQEREQLLRKPAQVMAEATATLKSLIATRKARLEQLERNEAMETLLPEVDSLEEAERQRLLDAAFARPPQQREEEEN